MFVPEAASSKLIFLYKYLPPLCDACFWLVLEVQSVTLWVQIWRFWGFWGGGSVEHKHDGGDEQMSDCCPFLVRRVATATCAESPKY